MKGIIIVLLYTISIPLTGQNYLNLTSTWKERDGGGGAGNPYFTTNDYTLNLTGDTILNGKTYYKVLESGIQTTWDWVADTLVEIVPIYRFLNPLREENRIFYEYRNSSHSENILHNFNLAVGDTAVSNCDHPQVVLKIDTIYIGGIPRKQFHFSPTTGFGTCTLIEGVGCTRGLYVKPCSGTIAIESGSSLQCYSQDDQNYQVDTSYDCSSLVQVKDDMHPSNSIAVSPNPFQDYINLYITMKLHTELNVSISDLNGRILKQSKFKNPNYIERLDLENLVEGAYIISISDNFSIQSKIIIKTR